MATVEDENLFTFEDTENIFGIEEPESTFTNEPVYVSIEGIFGGSSSASEDENDGPTERKRPKRESTRKSRGNPRYDDSDWECDIKPGDNIEDLKPVPAPNTVSTTAPVAAAEEEEVEDQLVALSKKQLNRLAAMDIYPIPSGGIGTVNASLFNPVTVKWLMKNFETVEGSSLPRFLVYNHYLLHCKSLNINPINAASFGKVIRSVFLGLQTRRLGTRGNSKYHYCGMRIKPDSPLLHVTITDTESKKTSKSGANGARSNKNSSNKKDKSKLPLWTTKRFVAWRKKNTQELPEKYLEFGVSEIPHTLEHLHPDADFPIAIAEGLTQEDIFIFKTHYRNHCSSLLSSVDRFRLDMVGLNWQLFYKAEKGDNALLIRQNQQKLDYFRPFTRSKLKKFVSNKNVQTFMNEADKQTYSNMAYLLCPHVTKTVPASVNQAVRNFLKVVEEWLSDALDSYPDDFKSLKLKTLQNVMRPLEQTLNTNVLYCSIQRMLKDQTKVNDLVTTMNGINFRQINTTVSWINENVPVMDGDHLKAILSRPDRLQGILTLIEKIVEEEISSSLPINEAKVKLQNTFLELSYYMTHIRKELVFISKESFETFSCMENFMLEYLKHFTHLRTGMQSVIASALASTICNGENSSSYGGRTLSSYDMTADDVEMNDSDESPTDDEVEATGVAFAKSSARSQNSDPSSQEGCIDTITNGMSDISVKSELDGWRDFLNGVSFEDVEDGPIYEKNKATTAAPAPELAVRQEKTAENEQNYEETFRTYFSASGYVTNYFNQKPKVGSDDDGSDNSDDNSEEEEEEEEEEDEDEEEDTRVNEKEKVKGKEVVEDKRKTADKEEEEEEEEEEDEETEGAEDTEKIVSPVQGNGLEEETQKITAASDSDSDDDPGVRFSFGLINS